MKKLSECELEIMRAIWQTKEPVKSFDVREWMKDKKWGKTTVLNFLARLVVKGFLTCETQGKINIYTPIIKEADYLKTHGSKYLKKFYNSSIMSIVAELYQSKVINDQDLEELKKFIEDRSEKV
jgi:BlaI family transcriptional regulator, penicillinase repressor